MIVTIDALADGDYTKWDFFGKKNVIEFLDLCQYHKDKMDEKRIKNALLHNRTTRSRR